MERRLTMDLLLDVNIVLDICEPRPEFAELALAALAKCRSAGGKLWLYAGSVQTLHHALANGLLSRAHATNTSLTRAEALRRSRSLLQRFTADTFWLASLAGEGDVFAHDDPEDEQLVRALARFEPGKIQLLTRDAELLRREPRALSPRDYLAAPSVERSLEFIDLATQQDALRSGIESRVHRVLHHGQYIMGPEVAELETQLAAYVGTKHCITVASGTDALLIAMMALGLKAGDEVITTPFTFIATGEMIALIGAKPVFVDIDRRTYNLDPALIEAAITPRTRAIMPVSLYGQCADFDAINAIAAKHGIPVIEDAAQSFGATYKGRQSCALSQIGCTSFFPSKPLGCYGDGGACFTDDDALAKLMREIRVHGQDRRYHHPLIGVNGRIDTLQCAVLLAKLPSFPGEIRARGELGTRYAELLKEVGIHAPYLEPYNTSVFAQYTVEVDAREAVQEKLKAAGIPTAVHYPTPLHLQPAFADLKLGCGAFPMAEAAAARVMSLPMHPFLEQGAQLRVAEALSAAVGR
jgi:UDP-2-acetamido-2-deoxy-ribo-hexuluronate aminotransferase